MDILREQVRKVLGVDLDELGGARLSGELPVTAAVINRLIAAKLAGRQGLVTAVRVDPLDLNVIDVHLTPASRLVPVIHAQAHIEQQPDLPGHPVLLLRWAIPGAGALARLAALFVKNLKSLPPGIRIDGELILVDLQQLLAAQGVAELLQYVRALRVDTRSGAFVVKFELGVR